MKERSEERGVSLDDVKDALTNPLHIDEIKHDDQGRPSQRFIGEGATVNINPETGIITTVWKTGSGKIKKIQKEMRKMTEEQKNFLISIGINPNDDLDKIDDLVSDYLVTHCLDEKYNPNEEGIMCESILDYIGEN